ncbi:MAG: DUF1579 domain-containing protein [Deltaproteobacteria bacterium]|nr:DUF1579 domain-containing protein [Deltaproteobacteria bacterium]
MSTAKKLKIEIDPKVEMEIYKKIGIPGAQHKLLERMAGSWKTLSTFWGSPTEPPVESSGVCEQKMILGGRFLQQECSGEMIGSAFTGIGFTGYDNHSGKFVSTWMDSLGTAIYVFEGKPDAGGSGFTQKCSADDPVRGPMVWRSVCAIKDDDTIAFEMYGAPRGGREEKMMEMTYTRKR